MRTSQQQAASLKEPVEVEIQSDAREQGEVREQSAGGSIEAEICPDQPLATRVEAILISADRPLTEGRIAEILCISGKSAIKRIVQAIEELNASYDKSGRSFRAERLAGGWQILTLPNFGPVLNRLHTERQQSKLSQPALETLAIVAYRQPIMRAEIEAIRGVATGEVLRSLMERRLIKIVGRAEELGRPMLYGTTKEFLKVFGLSGMEDLPSVKGLGPQATPAKVSSKETAPPNSTDDNKTDDQDDTSVTPPQ